MKIEIIEKELCGSQWGAEIAVYRTRRSEPVVFYWDDKQGPVKSTAQRVFPPESHFQIEVPAKINRETFAEDAEEVYQRMSDQLKSLIYTRIQKLAETADQARTQVPGIENVVRVIKFNRLHWMTEAGKDCFYLRAIHHFIAEAL